MMNDEAKYFFSFTLTFQAKLSKGVYSKKSVSVPVRQLVRQG